MNTQLRVVALAAAAGLAAAGCGGRLADTGQRLSARLVAAGEPVAAAPGEEITVSLMSPEGFRYILFARPDGTFAWPRPDIDGPALKPGTYAVSVARSGVARPGPAHARKRLTVEAGQTDGYVIELDGK